MPPRRQLPWSTKSGGNKTTVKPSPRKRAVPSDIDDDFFDGTVLESSRKGKERAKDQVSDSDLPNSSPRFGSTTRKNKEASHDARLPSSSPPPIAADIPPPTTEYMFTGVDKFDLRDDEWMMVEDELLQTAKLFTRHLHLAEYETLKTKMEELRKEAAPRPVSSNVKPSVEGHFKRKAQEQAKRQKKAIRELVSTRDSDSEGGEEPQRVAPNRSTSSFLPARQLTTAKAPATSGPLSTTRAPATLRPVHTSGGISHDIASDSDDLDAPKRLPIKKNSIMSSKATADDVPAQKPEVFVKPATPSKTQNKPARGQRRNLWDDWDELTANHKPSIPVPSPYRVSSPTKTVGSPATQPISSPTTPIHTPITKQTGTGCSVPAKRPPTPLNDDALNPPKRTQRPNNTADRLAKQKADKDRDEKKKQKYDDIPTFLF